jgi:hypothetical protein
VTAKAADLAARFPRLVEARSPSAATDGLWIIRPDGYVGLVDVAAAQTYLAAIAW